IAALGSVPMDLALMDRAGEVTPLNLQPPGPYALPRVSPDGSRVAVSVNTRSAGAGTGSTGVAELASPVFAGHGRGRTRPGSAEPHRAVRHGLASSLRVPSSLEKRERAVKT